MLASSLIENLGNSEGAGSAAADKISDYATGNLDKWGDSLGSKDSGSTETSSGSTGSVTRSSDKVDPPTKFIDPGTSNDGSIITKSKPE
jgi:hypothetical protein